MLTVKPTEASDIVPMAVGIISGMERNSRTHCDWLERNPNPNLTLTLTLL